MPCLVICLLLALVAALPAADYAKLKPAEEVLVRACEEGVTEGPAAIPWRLHVPQGASAATPLPLVVFMHGAGRRGTDNLGAMALAYEFLTPEAQAKHPCFVFAAQVPAGKRWVDQDFNRGSYDSSQVATTSYMQALLGAVDGLLASRPIDRSRVYIVGQSMGGYGTWDAIVRRPELWAAAVPICGAGDPAQAAAIMAIPIWAWHGENDTSVPVSGSRDMIAALKAAGAEPRYTEIAKGGHGVWVPALASAELHAWLFAQRRAQR
jgi:predicted peptidase